jgi:hypothetical protein
VVHPLQRYYGSDRVADGFKSGLRRLSLRLPALAETNGLIEEMAYALDTLKLDGVATSTSIDDIYLGDTRYDSLCYAKIPSLPQILPSR